MGLIFKIFQGSLFLKIWCVLVATSQEMGRPTFFSGKFLIMGTYFGKKITPEYGYDS